MDANLDFVELQVGGGGWAKASPPPILTPTHLRTAIKATNRDSGLISKAQAHHTQQTISPAPVIEIPGPTPKLFQDMENVVCFHHDQGGSAEGDGNVHAELDTGSCNSPPPGLLSLDYEKRGLVEPSNTTGTDPDTSSCNSPTLKGKLLGHEQRGSKEYGYAGVDTGSRDSQTLKEKPFGDKQRGLVEHGGDMHVCLATGSVEVSLPSGTVQVSSVAGGSLAPTWSTTNTADTLPVPWCNSPVASPQDLHFGNNNVDLDETLNESVMVRKKCYELFKKEHCDTWQEILIKFEESTQYTKTGKTVSQWQQLFNKSAKQFTHLFTALSKAHGIEAAFIMAGSVVNQDASLGFTYTTAGAEDFFMEHCCADTNAIIRHFKAHIYNWLSLACVMDTFHTDKLDHKGKAKERNDIGHDFVDLTSDNDGLAPDNGNDEREDHNLVKKLLTSMISL
ncbi:hypothetical protein PISMIDRAFT_17306 [Pisolithus microcarpus 441]|uniref:Uncharacterized protein n=1 Tax=Pisolithus microcarpus 441 TaxID=765257 RepID=A0A0C9YKM6_9AGAM|nr:hypothetical protein BKA83DRAFT_17306 [Pisolithus microcarpus]KIK14394.1 hypothetical protein PISMIDRAFT_17306 [Pisolithus microcarpus 441]